MSNQTNDQLIDAFLDGYPIKGEALEFIKELLKK